MKALAISIIAAMTLLACTDSTDTGTELEGNWESMCVPLLTPSGPTPDPLPPAPGTGTTPSKFTISFIADTVTQKLDTYSDANCTTLVTSRTFAEIAYVNPDDVYVRFEIGSTITTSNGVTVREIDFFAVNDKLIPDIYLLQNNGSTLYFGTKCYPDSTGITMGCTGDRPTELYYDYYLTKQN